MIYVFFANGFEETEAIVPVDMLRRAGLEVKLVSVNDELTVTGSHGIPLKADIMFDAANFDDAEMLLLPGGMPGTKNLDAHAGLCELLQDSAEDKKIKLAAICAAPSVFGNLGLLNGEKAVCYPGFEDQLIGATVLKDPVVVSNQFITARGAGAAMKFALKLVEVLKGKRFADELADAIVYNK